MRKYIIILVITIPLMVLIVTRTNPSNDNISFIGDFTEEERKEIIRDLENLEPTKTQFDQGGSVEIQKNDDKGTFTVKYYTSEFGDWVPADLIINQDGNYQVEISI